MSRLHSRQTKSTKPGFTLVELSIALVFLALLLITIAILTMNIIAAYQKGLAIKAVNATGRELIDDFSRAISASPSKSTTNICDAITSTTGKSKCLADNAYQFVYQQQTTNGIRINAHDTETKDIPTHGVFCTGRYSYIWNTGYTFSNRLYSGNRDTNAILKYKIEGSEDVHTWPGDRNHPTAFRLLKIVDQDRVLCAAHITLDNYELRSEREYDITATPLLSEPEELLDTSEDNLAIYDFRMFPPTQHDITLHSFYSGTFILATIQGGVDITEAGDYCSEPPDAFATDFNYCAINKFNFAMRAIGELNDDEKKEKQKYGP